jgi:hypothetical protein
MRWIEMARGRIPRAALVVPLALVLLCPASERLHAEPVRLALGGDLSGQGWMFRDRSGVCRIVTAGHNLSSEGKLRAPAAIDASGAEFSTGSPVWPDPTIDIGFLVARPARACPRYGLDADGIDSRLASSPLGFIEVVVNRATDKIAVRLRQRSMDAAGGRILLFDQVDSSALMQGISGAAIQDSSGRPLGIEYSKERDDGRLNAVRLDVVAGLLDVRILSAAPADTSYISGWSVQNGRSTDPARGPELSLVRSGEGWSVSTDRGFVMLTVRFKSPQSLSAVTMALSSKGPGGVQDIQVMVPGAGSAQEVRWNIAGRCPVPPGGVALRCAFSQQSAVSDVRVILRTSLEQFSISALTFER